MTQYGKYPDAFYRVSLKAVIRNEKNEVLCVKEGSPLWELPGGGVDHGETAREALARELDEEICYTGGFDYRLLDMLPLYDPGKDYCVMFIGVEVLLHDDYTPTPGKDVDEIRWIDPRELQGEDARAIRMIVKFAHDHTYPVAFTRNDIAK